MSLSLLVFARQHFPWCHVCFVKNERLDVKSRYLQDTILRFIYIIRRINTKSYGIKSFSHPAIWPLKNQHRANKRHQMSSRPFQSTHNDISNDLCYSQGTLTHNFYYSLSLKIQYSHTLNNLKFNIYQNNVIRSNQGIVKSNTY